MSRSAESESQLSAASQVEAPGVVKQQTVRGAHPGSPPQPGAGASQPWPEQHLCIATGSLCHSEQGDPAHPV